MLKMNSKACLAWIKCMQVFGLPTLDLYQERFIQDM